MIRFRDRMARGHTRTGTLDSRHTFSFGGYRDPGQMGFRALRVINEDRLIPSAGFATHAHQNMEIVTYVLAGQLRHRDNLGNGSIIRAGEMQRLSAGTGVSHSEFNASAGEPVHLLQLWIIPGRMGVAPSYAQAALGDDYAGRLKLAAGPEGSAAPITLQQDALIYLARLTAGAATSHPLAAGRGAWLQIARGIAALNDIEMREGDGAAIEDEAEIAVEATTDAEVLLFDLT